VTAVRMIDLRTHEEYWLDELPGAYKGLGARTFGVEGDDLPDGEARRQLYELAETAIASGVMSELEFEGLVPKNARSAGLWNNHLAGLQDFLAQRAA
jgi:hypothetical protein